MAKDYDRDAMDREIERTRPSSDPRCAGLKDLGDYEVAEGYPDPRGWTVRSADGREVGKVRDLIVDTGSMRTRYLAVRLDDDFTRDRDDADDRDVLIPIGAARVDDDGDNVIVNDVTADRFASLPAYDPRTLTRDDERDLRRHFTSGDAMSAGAIGAGATAGSDFYDHGHFNDRSFFARGRGAVDESERLTVSEERLDVGKRQVPAGEVGVRKNVETRHVEEQVELMREDVSVERRPLSADAATGASDIGEAEIRVPVMREEAVVEKRTVPVEEVVVRKEAVADTETVQADLRKETLDVDENVDRTRTRRTARTTDETTDRL